MPRMPTSEQLAAFQRNLYEQINACIQGEPGWWVQGVLPSEDEVGFCYTIGLQENFGSPELLMMGFDPRLMHNLVNGTASLVKEGTRVEDWSRSDKVIANYDVAMREVPLIEAQEWARMASTRADPHAFQLLQVFLPDPEGLFPWEDGVLPKYREVQGHLMHAMDFSTRPSFN